ncbi:MAG TPA: hypothetical protein VJK51_01620 [Candidatus Nanoarchaeia archaeon]|nr:hypothetical protein [Candidatus Nanoarchaeia archaeon]
MANTIKVVVGIVIAVLFLLAISGFVLDVESQGLKDFSSNILKYVFLGTDDLNSFEIVGVTNTLALLITALMVWLIIFVSFGDILENFSAFSSGIAWIIAFAVSVIAANVKFFLSAVTWLTGIFAALGVLAVYAGLLASFFAFFVVSWGWGRFESWLTRRRTMLEAHKGMSNIEAGVETAGLMGRTARREGRGS